MFLVATYSQNGKKKDNKMNRTFSMNTTEKLTQIFDKKTTRKDSTTKTKAQMEECY